jgi:hypothetical protein
MRMLIAMTTAGSRQILITTKSQMPVIAKWHKPPWQFMCSGPLRSANDDNRLLSLFSARAQDMYFFNQLDACFFINRLSHILNQLLNILCTGFAFI